MKQDIATLTNIYIEHEEKFLSGQSVQLARVPEMFRQNPVGLEYDIMVASKYSITAIPLYYRETQALRSVSSMLNTEKGQNTVTRYIQIACGAKWEEALQFIRALHQAFVDGGEIVRYA